MTKWITAERARVELQHEVVCPNATGRTKERIAQNKRARTGLLAAVDMPQWRELVSFWGRGRCYTAYLWRCLFFVLFFFVAPYWFAVAKFAFSECCCCWPSHDIQQIDLQSCVWSAELGTNEFSLSTFAP